MVIHPIVVEKFQFAKFWSDLETTGIAIHRAMMFPWQKKHNPPVHLYPTPFPRAMQALRISDLEGIGTEKASVRPLVLSFVPLCLGQE